MNQSLLEQEKMPIDVENQEVIKNQCHYCKKMFAHNSSLIKHIRIHTGAKPYLCNFQDCHQRFSQVSNLIRHKRIHTGIRPFVCNICQKAYTSSSNLNQHINIHKSKRSRSKFVCFVGDCDKSYLYICTLKKHISNYHKDEYSNILKVFEEETNFISIYKKIVKDPQMFSFVNFKDNDEAFRKLSFNSLVSTNNDEKEEKTRKYHKKPKHKKQAKEEIPEKNDEQDFEGMYSPMLPLFYNNVNLNLFNANYASPAFNYVNALFTSPEVSNSSLYASMKAQYCMNMFSEYIKSQSKHSMQWISVV